MPIIERRAGCEREPAGTAIDRSGAVGNQLDLLLAIEFVGAEHQAVRTTLALEIGFGQRRPLIGQMRLVVEQADALGKTMLPQRCRDLEARVTGADDQNCSLSHWVRPARCEMGKMYL